jgi:hypothetical protein
MSDRVKVSALTRRAVAVRGVVAALVNETISESAEVDPERLARLGLLAFEDEQGPRASLFWPRPSLRGSCARLSPTGRRADSAVRNDRCWRRRRAAFVLTRTITAVAERNLIRSLG